MPTFWPLGKACRLTWLSAPGNVPAPHFVALHTLESELCTRWRHLQIFHAEQRAALRKHQWNERHLAMSRMRPVAERDKWELGSKLYHNPSDRLQRSIYVLGLPCALSKEQIMSMFGDLGKGEVEWCHLTAPKRRRPHALTQKQQAAEDLNQHATLRFEQQEAAKRAIKLFNDRERGLGVDDVLLHKYAGLDEVIHHTKPQTPNLKP